MTDESRRANRRRLDQHVTVHDTVTEKVIGKLANLSETGMSLIAQQPVVNDALYQLRFELTDQHEVTRSIDAGVHELWVSESAGAGQTWVGFRFIALSPAHLAFIREWVNAPGAEHV